ncbi:MAG: nucleotidyltransferase family protein [Candidatus Thorarchaeota archaeon]|nr:nucleotidyltransferase family protein [Candidatus Thorarchaeota archaeon]
MKSIDEIRTILQCERPQLRKQFQVESIAFFGSYVRSEQTGASDIDILVKFTDPVSLLHIVSLENYLTDLLGIRVDIILKENNREELRDGILREAIPL